MKNFLIALRVSVLTLLLTGAFYPLAITGISHLFFHHKANGSLIFNEQTANIGSELIGQNFKNSAYFFSRPSSAGKGYDGSASGGSNLGPTSKNLLTRIYERVKDLQKLNSGPIPIDLVTTSGSGLDPHITPQAAYWQAPKIALARDVSLKRIFALIDNLTEPSQFYFLGSSRINVLKLNLALDQFFGSPTVLK